jgi:hypothetical protein
MDTAINNPRLRRKGLDARTLAASTGVTASLVAAAVIAFVSIAAFVGFEGMPFGADGSPDSSLSLGAGPQAAALTAGSPAAEGVAAEPVAPSAAAIAELAAAPPGTVPDIPGVDPPGTPPAGDPGTGTGGGGGGSGGGTIPGGETPATPGPLSGTVGTVDDAVGGLGLDLPLSGLTDPITQPIDDILGGALNGVGNSLGAGNLGNTAGGAVNDLNDTVGNLLP